MCASRSTAHGDQHPVVSFRVIPSLLHKNPGSLVLGSDIFWACCVSARTCRMNPFPPEKPSNVTVRGVASEHIQDCPRPGRASKRAQRNLPCSDMPVQISWAFPEIFITFRLPMAVLSGGTSLVCPRRSPCRWPGVVPCGGCIARVRWDGNFHCVSVSLSVGLASRSAGQSPSTPGALHPHGLA